MSNGNNDDEITKKTTIDIEEESIINRRRNFNNNKSNNTNNSLNRTRRYNPSNIDMPDLGMNSNSEADDELEEKEGLENEVDSLGEKEGLEREDANPMDKKEGLKDESLPEKEGLEGKEGLEEKDLKKDNKLSNKKDDDNSNGNKENNQLNQNTSQNNNNRQPQNNNQNPKENNQNQQNNGLKQPNNRQQQPNNRQQQPNNQVPQATNKTKKTQGSADKLAENKSKTLESKGPDEAAMAAKALNAKNEIKRKEEEEGLSKEEATKQVVQDEAKEYAKAMVKKKILEIIATYIIPILPYILLALVIIIAIFLIIFTVIYYSSDEDRVVPKIELNYCEYVNLKWGEGEDDNLTVSANEYIEFKIANSDFSIIDNKEALKALTVVYRTNLYSNSDNLDSNVCHFDVDQEYQEVDNETIKEAVKESKNRVFSYSETELSTLEIDNNFSYKDQEEGNYILYQDAMKYETSWVNSKIDNSNIVSLTSGLSKTTFSPFAAWYLAEIKNDGYIALLHHFFSPGHYKGNIYEVIKIGDDTKYGDHGGNMCSDISLSTTSLTKEEFVKQLNNYNSSNSSFQIFKANAEKIYDISVKNNFNPEMVVIRAEAEGYSPGGSTYNYWGIGCANGKKCSVSYSSFDQGVLGYINTVKQMNAPSLFYMQRKYAYIGKYWFNPGSWSLGGCKYFPYLQEYLSEERKSVVAEACQEGKRCENGGVGDCLPTTDEDQDAYTYYQISSMVEKREKIFGISADSCEDDGIVDGSQISDLGKAVAEYAVKTFDSYSYSQGSSERHSDKYVDCSSMVSRAYKHFNVKIYDSSDNTDDIYRWCQKNAKLISGGGLAPGDLIFYNDNKRYNPNHINGIGHVAMYIGNNKIFAAHGKYKSDGKTPRPQEDQVSVTSYRNDGAYFCRPTK